MTTVAPESVMTDEDDLSGRIRLPGIPLTLSDRCDGPGLARNYDGRTPFCGAQAFVRVKLRAGELLFCAHHYSQYESIFAVSGFEIDDQRSRINEKPSVSNADI